MCTSYNKLYSLALSSDLLAHSIIHSRNLVFDIALNEHVLISHWPRQRCLYYSEKSSDIENGESTPSLQKI